MNWFKKSVNIAVMVIAVCVAIAAAVILIIGVTTHKEAEILQVCWVGDEEKALYVDPEATEVSEEVGVVSGACTAAMGLVWPQKQLPLQVYITDLTNSQSNVRAAEAAVDDINRQLGFKMLTSNAVLNSPPIAVLTGMAIEKGLPIEGVQHWKEPDGTLRAQVGILSSAGSERLVYLLAHHGLLHAIGLAHDDFRSSAIFTLTIDDTLLERMGAARITDHDKALLRELYHE